MGSKDSNYQVVYRYEPLIKYVPGGWVLFQRPKSCGGGFWLGKTYDGVFMFELDRPFPLVRELSTSSSHLEWLKTSWILTRISG
ncbi:Uncharacterised protein [Klebsiella pneumoniae]|uniref:Uncharacterized protein n=1 Tax=Klebsiella pneumoniae TaxID=573 RepID=A0A377U021_KLEPN|nr:Uncharacterised protein [Klebsiella pneumoniae]